MIEFTMPLRTISPLNSREHWGKRARRVKVERAMTAGHLLLHGGGALFPFGGIAPAASASVLLTRIGPRTLDAGDNLPASMKGVRDQIAQWLGVNDADPIVSWTYGQERGKWGVRVRVVLGEEE